jgi:hypothetical protein
VTSPSVGLRIKLDDLPASDSTPYYVGDRVRLAGATSVKILDHETLACMSLLGRKIYLIRFDLDHETHRLLDVMDTVFDGQPVYSDLCDSDPAGVNVIATNFYLGTFSHYRRAGERLAFVRDLPFKLDSFVHGVKFFRPRIIAGTATKGGPTGVHFFDLDTLQAVLHVATTVKTQDVCFLSDRQLVIVAAHGSPTATPRTMYNSEAQLIDFNFEQGTFGVAARAVYEDAHFDCAVVHDGKVFVTDQFNNCIKVLDSLTLEVIDEMGGFDFPHGIDIKYNMIGVSNYGSNCIDLRPL